MLNDTKSDSFQPISDLPEIEKEIEAGIEDKMEASNQESEQKSEVSQIPIPPGKNLSLLKYLVILLLVTVTLAFIGTEFYLMKNKTDNSDNQATRMQAPTPTSNPTSNWKTYQDPINNYQIKYPSTYVQCTVKGEENLVTFEKSDICAAGEGYSDISINTVIKKSDFGTSEFPNCYSVKKEEIFLAGIKGIKYTSNLISNASNICKTQQVLGSNNLALGHIVLESGGKIYEISVPTNSENKNEAYLILNAFKFTEPSTLKTYTHPQYGYSFQYPSDDKITTEDAYSFITGKNVKVISIKSKEESGLSDDNPDKVYKLQIYTEDNPSNLTPREFINNYMNRSTDTSSQTKNETIGNKMITDGVNSKITNSLKDYKIGQISGLHAIFGFDYDYDVIVMTKGSKVYTFLYYGDQGGKISGDGEKTVNQILSSLKFIQ